jgi:DNA-directed RNA polymerase subunit RPC12/RpoP
MPTRCQDCDAKFLIDATSVVNGISCPDCGGKRLERDQPSPTHSDGDLRNMVDPATQLDQGGNPLQEGVWANIDGGWQPRYKRDESFASVQAAERGPFDMYDGSYPLPSGGEGHHYNCPNCGGQMRQDTGECYRCGYTYPYDGGEILDGHHDPVEWSRDMGLPVAPDLGPVHQGAQKVAAGPGITWTPGVVGHGGWDEQGNLHAWNVRNLPPHGVNIPHQPFILAADGTILRADPERLNEIAERIPGAGYRHQINAAAIQLGESPDVMHASHQEPMSNHNSRSLSQEPYLPWYHQADVKRSADDAGAPISLTNAELADDEKRGAYMKRQEGRDPKLALWPLLEPLVEPLVAAGGRALLRGAIGGLMKKAIGGGGNFLGQQPQDQGPPAGGAPPVGLVASEHTAVGVNAPVETPGSVPDYVEDHDPEAVDQQEYNDGDSSPAFNNPNRDVGDGGLSQGTGEDATKQKLQFREDGDALGMAETTLPHILDYINSEKSGLEHPQIKALHEALEQEIPGYLDHADENSPEVHKLLDELSKPDKVVAGQKEHMKGVDSDKRQRQYEHIKEQCMADGGSEDECAEMAARTVNKQRAEHGETKSHTAAPVYQNTPIPQAQTQMGNQQMAMPGTHQNPVQPGGMPVQGKCMNCGGTVNADGSCPQCGAAAGANQMGNLQQQLPGQQHTPVGIMPSQYASTKEAWGLPEGHGVIGPQQPEEFALNNPEQSRAMSQCPNCGAHTQFPLGVCPHCGVHPGERMAADHQGPITPQQKEVFAQYLIDQGRNEEVAAMFANPGLYADEWAQYLNKSTQPPEVDPAEQQPLPQIPPEQMGQMPVPGMQAPQPTARVAGDNPRRCPKCESATTDLMNSDGDIRCHRCGHVWNVPVTEDTPTVKSHWIIKRAYPDTLNNDSPNPVAAPAADATAPGDREQQQDSSLTWQTPDGQPLEVGGVYEMHSNQSPIPDVVKVQSVKPDSIVVQMIGEYNSPSDPQDPNGSAYTHEIPLSEAQTVGLTFLPQDQGGEQEQSQDNNDQDGIGQTVNTEPVEQPHDSFPVHTKVQPTDHCPECDYKHVTSNYTSPTEVEYECFRCAHKWKIADVDEDHELNPEARNWLHEDDTEDFNFDRVAEFAKHTGGQGRNIRDIAKRDPRNAEIRERLNKNAGAKFSPREQKEFIDEDGVARNADRLSLDGTHYVESAFDNTKARPDRVNDNYLGLGL